MTVNNFLSQPVGEMTRISIIFFVFMFAPLLTYCTHCCKHSLTNFPHVFTNFITQAKTTDKRLPRLVCLPFLLMVQEKGVEPLRVSSLVPKTSACTSSATPAFLVGVFVPKVRIVFNFNYPAITLILSSLCLSKTDTAFCR